MFYKEVDYNDYHAMFDFLNNHFTYDTLNSWNGLRSIAHNVKLYRLPDIDISEALEALEEDQYFSINQICEDWEMDHPGYKVAFNGRSGGYLVLYNNHNNGHVFDGTDSPCMYHYYEDWENDIIEGWGSLENYKESLLEQVKIVQEFDKLCDDLYEQVKFLIQEMKRRKELTRKYSATLRFQRYYYDTLEDLKLHMLDMKRRHYSLYEYSEEDLYAEYEMNEAVESEIVLEEEGDEEFI